LRAAKYGGIGLSFMVIKTLVKITIIFVVFHLIQYLAFYLLSATFFDGPLSVGFPLTVYTVSCGFAFQSPDCHWKASYPQNIVLNLIVWIFICLVVVGLKSKFSKK